MRAKVLTLSSDRDAEGFDLFEKSVGVVVLYRYEG